MTDEVSAFSLPTLFALQAICRPHAVPGVHLRRLEAAPVSKRGLAATCQPPLDPPRHRVVPSAEIGVGLTGLGFLFLMLGVLFFFDRGLLAMGNVSRATLLRPWQHSFLAPCAAPNRTQRR